MSNRKLLELAAKAAGIDAHWGDGWQSDMMFRALPRPNSPLVAYVEWNPITDDGDALRLAVKLHLPVEAMIAFVAEREPDWHKDPYAATRRAIVRAAAEIGRSVK